MNDRAPLWTVDPDDPRAPPQDVWDRTSPEERAAVLAALPSEFPVSEATPPQGDHHTENTQGPRQLLRRHFGSSGRRVYIAADLPVYYPGEPMFSPDVIAVVDVDPHDREYWMVGAEGKGLDLAIEVNVRGDRGKDLRKSQAKYARLGISEVFVFDWRRSQVHGWRLPEAGPASYQPILPQRGRFPSAVLGLNIEVDEGRLGFYVEDAPLPRMDELLDRLGRVADDLTVRLHEQTRRAHEEAQRADEEAQRADEEARRADELSREVERLRRLLAEREGEGS